MASGYTDEQKAAFVALARDKGRKAASKKAKVSTHTISTWAKAAGVKFTSGKKTAPRKRAKGVAALHIDLQGSPPIVNGHAPAPPAPPSAAGLAAVQTQLTEALAIVKAIRAAFRQTFG